MNNPLEFNQYKYFIEIANYAKTHDHIIDLSLGISQEPRDPLLVHYLKEASENYYDYAPLQGYPELIRSVIEINKKRPHYPIDLKENEINIIPCSTFGVYTSLQSILQPYDEVIVIEPCYYTYFPILKLLNAKAVSCALNENFELDFNLLESLINDKTKAIIINTPHNPTGMMLSKSDWQSITELICNKEIYIISEEVYDMFTYEHQEHYSPQNNSILKERTFSIFSFGKMLNINGWKVSYMIAPPELLQNFRNHQQYISYAVNSPAQQAVAKYLETYHPLPTSQAMEAKRNWVIEVLQNSHYKIVKPCQGAFYQLIDFSEATNMKNDKKFADYLLKEKQIAVLPLSAFYSDNRNTSFIRLSFSPEFKNVKQGLERLLK